MYSVLFLAVAVEGIVEWIKMSYQSGRFNITALIALAVSVLVTIGAEFDLFSLVGVPLRWPIVGQILTGVLISRGSNYIHSITHKICKKDESKRAP
ncbi:MAG TPA: hypothetical protein GXX17_01305 [Clostridiales bacterium]|nr:hypothetical protein [Clostridiales bacterium]